MSLAKTPNPETAVAFEIVSADHGADNGAPAAGWRRPREIWRAFKRLTALGWPRRFPLVQFPNLPLIVAFVAGQVAGHTVGSGHAYGSAISYLAMSIWAYEELIHGVNWFRHLLGLGYAVSTAVHLAIALQT